MARSKSRKEARDKKAKTTSKYNKTPQIPETPPAKSPGKFSDPGRGGSWSAPVGKRRTRVAETGAKEKKRTMSDNYGEGTRRPSSTETKSPRMPATSTGTKYIGK